MALDFSNSRGPDFNLGDDTSDLMNNFMNYRNVRQAHDDQFMKNLAEFQTQQKLKELSGQMQLMRENNLDNRLDTGSHPNTSLNGAIAAGHAPIIKGEDPAKLALEQKAELDKNKIAQEGIDVKKQALTNPDYVQMKTAGGDVYYIDKKTGRLVDTNVANGTLTGQQQFSNKQNLQQEGETAKSSLEENRQTNRQQNIKTRGQQIIDQIAARGKESRQTKSAPSPNYSGNLPTQDLVRQMNTARQFMNQNPDLANFITIDPNTKLVSVKQPGSSFFGMGGGPNQEQYQKILGALYPNGRLSVSDKPSQTPNQTPNTSPDQVTPTGHVKVTDGQRNYLWDTSKGAIPNGFKQVPNGGQEEDEQEPNQNNEPTEEGSVGY